MRNFNPFLIQDLYFLFLLNDCDSSDRFARFVVVGRCVKVGGNGLGLVGVGPCARVS